MSAADPFALGGRQDELMQLFRQWVESERRAGAYGREHPEDDDPEYIRLCKVAWALNDQMLATPAKSPTDLAIKVYMLAWHESGGSSEDSPRVSSLSNVTGGDDERWLSLLRDLPTFVPEMAELLAQVQGDAA